MWLSGERICLSMQETQETSFRSLSQEDDLEEEMETHSRIHSCLENPMDRGAWQAIVQSVCKKLNPTEHTHTHTHACYTPETKTIY